jgi:copper resistance protein C
MRVSIKFITLAASILFAVPAAFAHAHPKLMNPMPDSVGPAPKVISITFSEAIEAKFSSIQLTDESGKSADKEVSKPAPGDPKTLTLVVPSLAPGSYIVHWVNVATDGHRMDGEYKFTVK